MAEITATPIGSIGADLTEEELKAADKLNKQVVSSTSKAGHNTTVGRDKDAYGRQYLAGLTDIATGIPTLAGLAGAGIESLGRYAITDDDLATSFDKSLKSGVDRFLFDAGTAGRSKVNELLNIPEPKGKGETIARLASAVIPNPLMFGKWATLGVNLATPLVKVVPRAGPTVANALVNQGKGISALVKHPGQFATKGNALRLGAQSGLAVGFDQGARALAGEPTLFDSEKEITFNQGARAAEPLVGGSGDDTITATPLSSGITATPLSDSTAVTATPNKLALIDQQLKDEETERTANWTTLGIAMSLATIAAIAWRRKLVLKKQAPSEFAPMGQGQSPEKFVEGAGAYVHGEFVDGLSHVKAVLRDIKDPETGEQLIPERHIDQLLDAGDGDTVGKAQRVGIDGHLPTTDASPGIDIPSLRGLTEDLAVLTPEQRATFMEGMVARREKVQRIRSSLAKRVAEGDEEAQRISVEGTADEAADYLDGLNRELIPTGLFKNNFRGATGEARPSTNTEVDDLINAMEADEALSPIVQKYGEITSGLLDFAVSRKVITQKIADLWRREYDFHGSTVYIPGRELNERAVSKWYERLGAAFGMGTNKQKELAGMAQFQSGIASEGTGIKNPLGPLDSLGEYMYHIIDHTDRSVAQWNILSRLTGVDELGQLRAGHPGSRSVTFLGIHDPANSQGLKAAIKEYDPSSGIKKLFRLDDEVNQLQTQAGVMEQVMIVQRNGKEYLFHVPDEAFREVMGFKPKILGSVNKVGRAFKNAFQATTTRLPFFTPISFGYTTQQAWQNAVARGAKFTPWDAFKGAWRGSVEGLADEIGQQWAHSIATNTGLVSRLPREFAERMTAKMKKVVENSLLNGIQRQQGATGSSIATSEFSPDVVDIMKMVAPAYRDGFSGISSAWRMYNIINKAIHEGAANGGMLRQLKSIEAPTGQQFRSAGRTGKTLAGDVRRQGRSDAATAFNSWVPFSGAMIQSWNSIGSALRVAIKNNPTRAFASLSLPMIPAIMEAANNSLLGEEYSNYYWNKLTTEQRNNNIHLFIPGRAPEDGIVIPVSPEWTLVRGMGIEMVDAMTGASRNEHMPKGQRLPSGNAEENGAHFMAGLVRVFDIPVPPAIQAVFAAAGYNLRLGPQYHNGNVQLLPLTVRELTQGERVSGDRGRSRYVEPAVDTEVEGVFRATLGAVGSAFLSITEVFNQGQSEDFQTGIDMGIDQLVNSVRQQTKYLQPIWAGDVFKTNSNDEIADSNRAKQNGIKVLEDQFNILQTNGKVFSVDNPVPFAGNSVRPTDDPVVSLASQFLPAIKDGLSQYKQWNSIQRKLIQDLRSSTRDSKGNALSLKQRNELLQKHEITIRSLNAKQNMMLQHYEDAISDHVNKQLGLQGNKAIEFSFNNFKARPNLGTGLILKAPRK